MRISDWSSDVCSSDLAIPKTPIGQNAVNVEDHHAHLAGALLYGRRYFGQYQRFGGMRYMVQLHSQITLAASKSCICKAPNKDRKSVVSGKRVSGSVDLGGSRIITRKK